MKNTVILDNPILQETLNNLRNKDTRSNEFRMNLRRAGYLMTYEILAREAEQKDIQIETMLGIANGKKITDKFLQIMVMRAGQPFTEGGAMLLDEMGHERYVGVVDAKRIEGESLDMKIELGKIKVPKFDKDTQVIIYDPMIGTGSTMEVLLNEFKSYGQAKNWVIASILAAPYGLEKIHNSFPNVKIYTLAIDHGGFKGLNEKGYIVPGLGDCGDRAFGRY